MNKEQFENRKKTIDALIHDELYVPMKIKEIAILLNIPKEDRADLAAVLEALVAEGRVVVSKKGKYQNIMAKKLQVKFLKLLQYLLHLEQGLKLLNLQ